VPSWLEAAVAWAGVAVFGGLGLGAALFNVRLFHRHVCADRSGSYLFGLSGIAAVGLAIFGPFACGLPVALTLAVASVALDGLPLSLLEDGLGYLRSRRRG
jgi:hypothetical protein